MSGAAEQRPGFVKSRFPSREELRDGRAIYWWTEVAAVLVFYGVYSAIRNASGADATVAFGHARELIHWERILGVYHEQSLESWGLRYSPFVSAMNYVYGTAHFAVTAGTGVFLFRQWRDDYPRWRNTLAVTTALALVGFYAWPLMPPRLLPAQYGFVDTLTRYATPWSFNSGAISKLSNQFAAMPSLHTAWSLWCAAALVPRVRARWAKITAALYPCLTITVIVFTGNHYFLDVLGGIVTFGVGYIAGRLFTKAGRTPVAPPADQLP